MGEVFVQGVFIYLFISVFIYFKAINKLMTVVLCERACAVFSQM